MYDVIVIGGGPGGISSSIYAASRGLKTLVLEKEKVGGMVGRISTVTHYTGLNPDETGLTFGKRIKDQALNSGVEIKYEEVLETFLKEDIKEVKTKENTYKSKVVIIASGTIPKKLNISGEEKYYLKGLLQNAMRDFENFKDKTVIVVGGSDGACKEALFLSKYANEVYIVHHGEKLGAISEFTTQIKNKDNMKVLLNSEIIGFEGKEYLEKVTIKDLNTNEEKIIEKGGLGVFVHIGADPANGFFKEVEMENGYIKVDENQKTNILGVYGVGDIRTTKVRQVSTAVADGTRAAIDAFGYINK